MESVNLKDVSRAAGCSVSTVSHILAGRGERYSDEMRQQVARVARELGYRPNQLARGLRAQKSFVIGVIVPEFFFRLDGIERRAAEKGYRLQMGAHHGNAKLITKIINDFVARQVDALLLCYPEIEEADLTALVGNKPTVIVDAIPWLGFDSFVDELRGSAEQATGHLLKLGHRRLIYLGPGDASRPSQQRIEGFRHALLSVAGVHGAEIAIKLDGLANPCELAEQAIEKAMKTWTGNDRPTAIVASNCETAVGAIAALRRAGIDVPGEMSVISIADQVIGRYGAVPVTAIASDVYQHIGDAMDNLLNRVEGGVPAPVKRYAPQLEVRDSCTEVNTRAK